MKTQKTSHRVADLPQNERTAFLIEYDQSQLDALRDQLKILGLRKLRFEGHIATSGKRDWQVSAHLGTTVVQSCVVSLAPVTTRIEHPVSRLFVARYESPIEEEHELTEQDDVDPLGETIDLGLLLEEELALALPLYPRATDAELTENNFTEPGKIAMRDEDTRPFAGLAGLRDKLSSPDKK